MKKMFSAGIFFGVLFFVTGVLAQEARLIGAEGKVSVKKTSVSGWQKAEVLMRLQRQAEIRTGKGAVCRVAFDEEAKNVVTIKENSSVKIEEIRPGSISLARGRVFSIIDNLARIEGFQVRTPTAIAGARGTGWSVGFANALTSVLCFENVVHVSGVDTKGAVTQTEDLGSGYGVDVDAKGFLGSVFEVSDIQQREWDELKSEIADVRQEIALPQKTAEVSERTTETVAEKTELQESGSEDRVTFEEGMTIMQKDISSFEKENMMSETEKTMQEFENLRDTTSAAGLRETVREEQRQETVDSSAQNIHEKNKPGGDGSSGTSAF